MIYICVICTGKKLPLLSLSDEHRRIIEAIVSPTLNLNQLQSFPLWICDACQSLINTVETFKNIALVGASHLLTRLASVQEEQDERLQLENPLLLPVKQDPDDLLEVKSFVEFTIEQQHVETITEIGIDIKDDPDADSSVTASCELDVEDRTVAHTIEKAVVPVQTPQNVTVLPVLVTVPCQLAPALDAREGRSATFTHQRPAGARARGRGAAAAGRGGHKTNNPSLTIKLPRLLPKPSPATTCTVQAQTPKLPTPQNTNVKLPTLTLHPLTLGASNVDNNSDDNDGQNENVISDLFLDRPTSTYCCHVCRYEARDTRELARHCCGNNIENSEGKSEAKSKNPASHVKRRIKKPPGAFRCKVCNVRFADEVALAKHTERRHKETEVYICEICKKEFKIKYVYKVHMALHKRKESQSVDTLQPELFCAECGVQFQSQYRYNAHIMYSLKHTPRDKWRFKCDTCGKLFINKYELKLHMNSVHLNKPDHQCPQCHKVFRRRHLLQQHVDKVHEGKAQPRPHVCHVCAAAFTIRRTLNEHLATHSNVRPYACPLCPATFKFKAALFTHNRLKHLNIKRNWKKKPKKGKEEKKEQKVVENNLENANEIQSGS